MTCAPLRAAAARGLAGDLLRELGDLPDRRGHLLARVGARELAVDVLAGLLERVEDALGLEEHAPLDLALETRQGEAHTLLMTAGGIIATLE